MAHRNKNFVHKSPWVVLILAQKVVGLWPDFSFWREQMSMRAQPARIFFDRRCTASTNTATFSGGVY